MAVRGKWGITRDPNGELALIWAWPWFWRYPAALAVAAFSAWLVTSEGHRPEWVIWTMAVGGLLVALSIAYELGWLAAAATVIWAVWAGLSHMLSLERGSIPEEVWLWALAAFAYYAWHTGNQAKFHAEQNLREINHIWQCLNRIEQDANQLSTEQWCEIDRLQEEIKRLRDARSDGFDEPIFP